MRYDLPDGALEYLSLVTLVLTAIVLIYKLL